MEILPVAVVLGGFGVYATLRAFENAYYFWGPYLSPFYSPLIDPQHHWWPFSPALLILAGPLGFRATCYYYRKAYYRAFFLDPPPAPSVNLLAGNIAAKRLFPSSFKTSIATSSTLLFSLSRFFGTTPSVLFSSTAASALVFGSLVLTLNVSLLSLYTFSCHSLRHLAGGKLDCFSCANFGRSASLPGRLHISERAPACSSLVQPFCRLCDFYVRSAR